MEEKEKKVIVILSTYNGEKYLETQLMSILSQTHSNLKIYIRDDGSKDRTLDIIRRFEKENDNIIAIEGENLGAKKSFFKLISHINEKADYYSFCDQDDYWYPEKLKNGIMKLEEVREEIPLMYCSALNIADKDLNVIGYVNYVENKKRIGFGNAIVENINTGCTCIINDKLFKLLKRTKVEQADVILMHDWWIYLIATNYGKVVFDDKSYIKYRQHENNCVGANYGIIEKYKKKIGTFKKGINHIALQLEEFEKTYTLKKENNQLVDSFINSKRSVKLRFVLIFNGKIYRMKKIDNCIIKVKILLGLV